MIDTGRGTIKAFVKSRRVPVRVTQFSQTRAVAAGLLSASNVSLPIYEHVLDEPQERLLKEAQRLSLNSGLRLEVVDLTRQNPMRRLLSKVPFAGASPSYPELRLHFRNACELGDALNQYASSFLL